MDSSPNSCRLFSEWSSCRASCNLAPSLIGLESHLLCCTGCSLCLWEVKHKSLFVGLTLIFSPPSPQSSASISCGVERVRPPVDPQHAPSLTPCLRFRGRVSPPVVKLNLCSSVNYTVNYRVEPTFRPGENKRLRSHIGFLLRRWDSLGSWCPQQQDSLDAARLILRSRRWLI